MGQQQLLLIALSVIIVGAAVAVGVNMFNEGAASMEADKFYQKASTMAANFGTWYSKPVAMGGGGQDADRFPTDDVDQAAAILGVESDSNVDVIILSNVIGTVADIDDPNSTKTWGGIEVELTGPSGVTAEVVLSGSGRARWDHENSEAPTTD